MQFFLYILVLSTIDVFAISFSRQWQISQRWQWLGAAIVLFCLMPIIFARSTAYAPSGIANAVWVATSTILITITGYLIFKESLNTQQIIGLIIILVGLIIIEIK